MSAVHQVRAALINAQFPPLAGLLVMLDFLIRHQLLDVDAEEMGRSMTWATQKPSTGSPGGGL